MLFVVAGIIGDITAFKILLVIFLAANVVKHYVMYKQRSFRKEYEEVYFKEKEQEEKQLEEHEQVKIEEEKPQKPIRTRTTKTTKKIG